jgi:polar amino acid transport system permease protein
MTSWVSYIPLMLDGLWVTTKLTVLSCVFALPIAFLAGLGRIARFRAIRIIAGSYVEFFRGTSIFVQLFWIYYVLPLFGLSLEPMAAGVIALSLNLGAYAAEVVRGGILSVARDQLDASKALNLTSWQTLLHVALPQALPLMLPVFGNNCIELLKATSVVSLISLGDLTFQTQVVRAQTGTTLMPFLFALALYFALSSILSALVGYFERRSWRGLGAV